MFCGVWCNHLGSYNFTAEEKALSQRAARAALARNDFLAYCQFIDPNYKTSPSIIRLASTLQMVESGKIKRLIVIKPPQHGKAVQINTPIATPNGWRTIGSLRPGDFVFGADGKPTEVVGVSPVWHNRPLYTVQADDREEILVDAAHEWLVRLDRKKSIWSIRETQWLAERTSPRKPMVKASGALDLPERELLIDPYVLGIWLGDGSKSSGQITQGSEDVAFVRGEIERRGYSTSKYNTTHFNFNVYGLLPKLRQLNLFKNKHIPDDYLWASEAQRRDLLRGLIDSDGYVANDGQIEFTNKNKLLALQVQNLVWSLGAKASLLVGRATLDRVDYGTKYRVVFYMKGAALLPRKAERTKQAKKSGRYLTFTPAGFGDTVCIEVAAPDHLFLIGHSLIPTHNSLTTSGYFPSWCMGRGTNRPMLLTSYGADLAERWSVLNRDTIAENPNYRLVFPHVFPDPGKQGKERWSIMGEELSLLAAGVHGMATGFPAWGIVFDDPFKNYKEASSPTVREDIWNSYLTVSNTRLQENGWIVVIGTRWHEDDLIGRIQAEEGDKYHTLHLPALSLGRPEDYEDTPEMERRRLFKSFPKAAFPDPLNRPRGEALWPEHKSKTFLLGMKRLLKHFFSALFQGIPSAPEGNKFKKHWLGAITSQQIRDLKPQTIAQASSYDLAWSAKTSADYTVRLRGTLYYVEKPEEGDPNAEVTRYLEEHQLPMFVVIEKVSRWQAEWNQTHENIAELAQLDTRKYQMLVEAVASQNIAFKNLRQDKRLRLHTIIPVIPTTDKVARSNFTELLASNGGIYILYDSQGVPPDWEEEFIAEVTDFPHAENDDQLDTLTQLINYWEPKITQLMDLKNLAFNWTTPFMKKGGAGAVGARTRPPEFTEMQAETQVDKLGWAG